MLSSSLVLAGLWLGGLVDELSMPKYYWEINTLINVR